MTSGRLDSAHSTAPAGPVRRATRGAGLAVGCGLVFVVAFVARLGVALSSGGLRGYFGYDAGVYYAAADALTFGRLPYRDFVLLHPPGLMLALTPFAWLGRLTTDHRGLVCGVLAFMVLGAVDAVLVVLVSRRLGLSRWAAVLGGLFYGVWLGSVSAEYLTRMAPLGNFLVLCGLLAYLAARRSSGTRAYLPVLAGAAFGAAASTKIWWAATLVVFLAWHLHRQRRRDLGKTVAGAAIAMVVINGPFLAAAPSQMWHMVLTEQLGRPQQPRSLRDRVLDLAGINPFARYVSPHAQTALAGLLVVLFLIMLVLAWRVRLARLAVVLAVAQGIVLAAAPSWFDFYADYLTPLLAVCLAAAVASCARGRPRVAWRALVAAPVIAVLASAAITTVFLAGGRQHAVTGFPSGRLGSAVRDQRCVMSDSPMALILLDSLSRDLGNGCRNWVDVTGRTYGADAAYRPDGAAVPRPENAKWQHDLLSYLGSGGAVILMRPGWPGTGISAATRAALERGGVLARAGHHVVWRTSGDATERTPSNRRR